jgi:hypothetical protein
MTFLQLSRPRWSRSIHAPGYELKMQVWKFVEPTVPRIEGVNRAPEKACLQLFLAYQAASTPLTAPLAHFSLTHVPQSSHLPAEVS